MAPGWDAPRRFDDFGMRGVAPGAVAVVKWKSLHVHVACVYVGLGLAGESWWTMEECVAVDAYGTRDVPLNGVCLSGTRFRYSRRVYTVRVPVSALCGTSAGCLGARGAGGALQGRLGEASGEGSDAGVCQRGGRKQLIPAADGGRQVQVLQEDLSHSHEALVVHTSVIPPHYYLEEK